MSFSRPPSTSLILTSLLSLTQASLHECGWRSVHIIVLSHGRLINANALEESHRQEFNNDAPDQGATAKKKTKKIFSRVQRLGLNSHSSDFYHYYLSGEGYNHDKDEHRIVAKVCKYIEFISMKFSRIDNVE